jgi:hypothetical protein
MGVRPSPRHLAALIVSNSLLLPIGIGTALVWANLAPHSYVPFAHKTHTRRSHWFRLSRPSRTPHAMRASSRTAGYRDAIRLRDSSAR